MTGLNPLAARWRDVPLMAIIVTSALTSIGVVLLDAMGWSRPPFTINFVALPGMVCLAAIAVWAGRSNRRVILNRLAIGAAGGIAGLLAYDAVRLAVQLATLWHFDAFASMAAYGSLITARSKQSIAASVAGWIYHGTNGLTFGIVYVVVAGPARWWWGLAWGMVIEVGMLLSYPAVFASAPTTPFIATSLAGHAAFGSALGL